MEANYKHYLRALFNSFDFCTRAWFLPTRQSIEINKDLETIVSIHRCTDRVSFEGIDGVTNRGCYDYLKVSYLREVWVAEITTNLSAGETEEAVVRLVEGSPKPDGVSDRTWIKLKNLNEAFDGLQRAGATSMSLSIDMVRAIHKQVGHEIMEGAGAFRTTHAGAAGTVVIYVEPRLIQPRLLALIHFANEILDTASQFNNGCDCLRMTLRIAAMFFSEFLKIHPFSNGNGRVARLLVNFILSRVCCVPISLFLGVSRAHYLEIIQEAQWKGNPSCLTTMFLQSAKNTAHMTEYLLLDNDDTLPNASQCDCFCSIC